MYDDSGTSCVLLDLKSLRSKGNQAYKIRARINDEPICGVAAQYPWIGRMGLLSRRATKQVPSAGGKAFGLGLTNLLEPLP